MIRRQMILGLLALPAAAHHAEVHPQQMAQAERSPRERRNPAAPQVPEQNRDASQADAAGIDDAAGLLNAAATALRSNRRGTAIEFMERAESRLLTRSTPAPRAGDAVAAGPPARIAAARAAVAAGDIARAQSEIAAALAELNRPPRRRGRREREAAPQSMQDRRASPAGPLRP